MEHISDTYCNTVRAHNWGTNEHTVQEVSESKLEQQRNVS